MMPMLGQGTSHLGKGHAPPEQEEAALRAGIALGMSLIDTAEVYGSEELVGRAIAGQRHEVFLVSKIWPGNVPNMGAHCDASLRRLGTDYLDLYLLHWPNGLTSFEPVVSGFERLWASGKIRYWGVSNFDLQQMQALFTVPYGDHCATNQVLYNLRERGIERELLPWCGETMPVMAYSPLGGPGAGITQDPVLVQIAAAHACSPAAVALAWTIRSQQVIAIPKASSVEHVKQNADALTLRLTPDELQQLDAL